MRTIFQKGAYHAPGGAAGAPCIPMLASRVLAWRFQDRATYCLGRQPIRSRFGTLHKYLGLMMLAFWAAQALTGLAISFRAEIDDWRLKQNATRTSPAGIGAAVERLDSGDAVVSSLWKSGGAPGQFDIYLTRDAVDRTVRIDGSGRIVRDRADSLRFADGAIFETLTAFHQNFLLGDTGRAIVGFSGVLLISNIVIGIGVGWRKRQMRRALTVKPSGSLTARTYGWHRMIGYWGALPAFILVSAGLLLAFSDRLEAALNVESLAPKAGALSGHDGQPVGPADAIKIAVNRFPGSELTALTMPHENAPWYAVRVHAAGEMPRTYGATHVYIAVADGAILRAHDARRSEGGRWLSELLYPLHTGQVGGRLGRIATFAIGLWLIAMIAIGITFWNLRRPRQS